MFLQVCTAKMNLGDEVDLEDYVSRPDKISAAEVCLFSLFLILPQMIVWMAFIISLYENRLIFFTKWKGN